MVLSGSAYLHRAADVVSPTIVITTANNEPGDGT